MQVTLSRTIMKHYVNYSCGSQQGPLNTPTLPLGHLGRGQ